MTQAFLTHNTLIFYIVCNMLMTFPLFKSNIPFMQEQAKNVPVFHNVCLDPALSFCCGPSVFIILLFKIGFVFVTTEQPKTYQFSIL